MKNKSLIPEIRFKGYDNEWTESVISEHFNLYSGTTPSRSIPDAFNGNVNWISSGELKPHYIGETKEKISEDVFRKSSLRLLPPNLLVIAIYGLEAAGVRGTASITSVPTTISQACTTFIPKSSGKVDTEFLYGWYKHNGNFIGTHFAQGTKQQNLKSEIINELSIHYPQIDEQLQIGDLLKNLDTLIADTEREILRLEKMKQASLQKMFPRQGETVPEIRFGGFSEPWELTKLEIILGYHQPQLYIVEKSNYVENGIPVLTAGKSFVLGYTNETFGVYKDTPVILFDDFTTDKRFVDFPFKVKSSAAKILSLKSNDYDLYFIFQMMENTSFDASSHRRYWISDYSQLNISVPSLSEQQKISKYFRNLNNLISAKRQKLSKFQNLKQSCLDKMFINTTAQ